MSNDGGPAFPVGNTATASDDLYPDFPGMTLRDYFAGQALAGMLPFDGYSAPINSDGLTADIFAESAYELADAMLSARKEGQS